jgi:hypothetical protein
MAKNEIRKSILKSLILFFFSLIIVGSFISESYGDEDGALRWGFSIAGSHPQKSKHDLTRWTFLPRLDMALHKSWDLEFEGNFSYYGISKSKNLYLLGLNSNMLFKPIQWNEGSLFLIGGDGGLAYNNNSDDNRRVRDIGDSHIAGILQRGSGIQYLGSSPFFGGNTKFSPCLLDNGY